jgi:4-amino-4-deoxychorismate lyase
MLDEDDAAVCATGANLFAVLDGALVTPDLSTAGVAGVMRRTVMEIAPRCGLTVSVRRIACDELARASELMLSSSLIGLWRVRRLDARALPGDAVWRRLVAALAERGVSPPS